MPEFNNLRNRVAVVGVGTTAYGSFPETDEYGVAAEAFRNALDDCKLDKSKIDGLLTCRIPSYSRMGEVLGLDPRWTITLPGHGRMFGIGLIEATIALASGQANTVALLYANIGRSRRVFYGGDESPGYWDPWGFTSPGAAHALMFRRHMELYGTTTRQLAEVSVAFRHHAQLHPNAVMKALMTIDDHEASRFIVAPLRLLDYCLINDGAVCLILTTKERAADLAKPPVLVSGFGGREACSAWRVLDSVSVAKAALSSKGALSSSVDGFPPTPTAATFPIPTCRVGLSTLKRSASCGANAARVRCRIARLWPMRRRPLARASSSTRALEAIMDRDQVPQPQDVYRKPLPVITPLTKPFWDYAARSIFALQTCDACGDAHVPPSPVCPKCLSEDQSWKPASGRGTLESWADFHRAYWDGFKAELPYRTCLVKLDEGPLIISNLVGDDAKTRIGARLRVMFERVTEEIAIPKFALD